MESVTLFMEENINWYLLLIIVLGGIYITKYTKSITDIKNEYKVLIASVVFSTIFYFIDDCKTGCLPQYLFTYLFATSFYELIVKSVVNKLQGIFNK